MSIVEDVAHRRIDSRLATCLLERRREDDAYHGTHEDLAAELGTAREVTTRQLKTFERRGWVETGRGSITLRNPMALRQISTHKIA
jgi:CRP/FNR family transcriptional regulator